MKKGVPVTATMPNGYSIRYNSGRVQPYTLWLGEKVECFCVSVAEAQAFTKNPKLFWAGEEI